MTLSLAAVREGVAAFVAEAMATGMRDQDASWRVSGAGQVAVAVGGPTAAAAGEQLLTGAAGMSLAVDGPAWERAALRGALRRTVTSGSAALEGFVAGARADTHLAGWWQDTAVAYRSVMSPRPLFYVQQAEGSLLVASQIRGLRAVSAPQVDPAGLGSFLVPQLCDPTGSAWSGVRRLPPGHLLTWRDGHLSVRHLTADPGAVPGTDPRPSGDDDPAGGDSVGGDAVREFRERFLDAVMRCTGPRDAILLSGGIDSSALACAYQAAAPAVGDGRTAVAYSLTYDERMALCDERRFADDVEARTGLAVRRLEANRLLPFVAGFPESDEPQPWSYAARNWAMLQYIAADSDHAPVTVVAGEGGDELLLGQVFALADQFATGDPDAEAELATFGDPVGTRAVVDGLLSGAYARPAARIMRALGELPPWLTSRYLRDAGLVERLADGYPRLGAPGHLATSHSHALFTEMGAAGRVHCGGWSAEMGRRLGLRMVYPFLDPDLVALVWTLPARTLRRAGLEKAILRDALADLLPASVLTRPDKADALAMLHAGIDDDLTHPAGALRRVARGGPLADLGILDPAAFDTGLDRYLRGDLRLAPALWATAAVDRWLTDFSEHPQHPETTAGPHQVWPLRTEQAARLTGGQEATTR